MKTFVTSVDYAPSRDSQKRTIVEFWRDNGQLRQYNPTPQSQERLIWVLQRKISKGTAEIILGTFGVHILCYDETE